VGILLNPENPAWTEFPAVLRPAAEQLHLELTRFECRGERDIEDSLSSLATQAPDALLMVNDAALAGHHGVRARVIELARGLRMPSASTSSGYARYGGLLSFGTDIAALRERAAFYVHAILRGSRAADLPVERPTKFTVSINIETAKELGIEIPAALLARADEVIE
jgi:putative tryptophan/tyrosine transport system substrate-binding protein